MNSSNSRSVPMTLPGAQVLSLVELVADWRIEPLELLAGSGLTVEQLEEPSTRVPCRTYDAIVSRARVLTDEPALGIFMGLRRRLSMYGFLGFAALSAKTLRQVLELAERYSVIATAAIRVHFRVEGGLAVLHIEDLLELGENREIATFALVVSVDQCLKALTGCDLRSAAYVRIPKPLYVERFAELLPTMHFDQAATKYVFDATLLELRPISSDRVGLRLAKEQCDRELHELALIGGISDRVRTLCCKHDGMRSLKEVAAQLEMSRRTLNRRLAAEGVLFSQLLDSERLRRAQLFLRTTDLSLSEIGVKLGYSTLPNFARAFRRWTGRTPEEYRLAARSTQREREPLDAAPAGEE